MRGLQSSPKLGVEKNLGVKKSTNTNSEIYRARRYLPKFHRYTYCPPSADEEQLSSKRDEMEGCEGNPSVPFTDITNIFVCNKLDKISHNFDGTDSDSRYDILPMDV